MKMFAPIEAIRAFTFRVQTRHGPIMVEFDLTKHLPGCKGCILIFATEEEARAQVPDVKILEVNVEPSPNEPEEPFTLLGPDPSEN